MKRVQVVEQICAAMEGMEARKAKAQCVAELIRGAGSYRWVGLYDVSPEEISIIAWSGPGAPAYPRFPADKGLSGAAVRSGAAVIVNDVAKDPRYLTALSNTRSEMIVPVLDPATGVPVGTIDVESEHINAFRDEDRVLVQECAVVIIPLFTSTSVT